MRRSPHVSRALYVCALICSLSLIGRAAVASPIIWIGDAGGQLGTVDTNTGTATVIGSMGHTMFDIAFDNSGNLYGITSNQLFSIDTTTAAATLIGNHNTGSNALVFGPGNILYAADDRLFTIDTITGAATVLGNGGDSYIASGDLAFIGGDLFLSSDIPSGDELFQLDVTSGVGSDIGSIGYGNVWGLITDNNVDLYGISGTTVLEIDPQTGSASTLLNYSGQGLYLAWGAAIATESSNIPEPGTAILLGMGLAGIGISRRQNAKGQ